MENEKMVWTAKPAWWEKEMNIEDPDMTPEEVRNCLYSENEAEYKRIVKKLEKISTPNGVLALMWSPQFPARIVCQIKNSVAECFEKSIQQPCWFIDELGEFRRRSELQPARCWRTVYREINTDMAGISRFVEILSGSGIIPDAVDQAINEYAVQSLFLSTSPLGPKIDAKMNEKSILQRGGVIV
jgi:hypothetical protein